MLNWIVIGIGDIAVRRVIPAIQAEPRSRLYGLVTRDSAKAAPFNVRTWSTLDEALADPEVHATYTPSTSALPFSCTPRRPCSRCAPANT